MFGMLDCAKNYKNSYKGDLCSVCQTVDDENHRINSCTKQTCFLFVSMKNYRKIQMPL